MSSCSPGSKAARKSRRAATRRRSGRRCWRMRSTKPILPALDAADFMAEWKWDGIRVQAVAAPQAQRNGRRQVGDRAALFAHRRGYFQKLSRSARRAAPARRHRRRASDHARRPRAVVQRAAAAAQSQNRHAETDRGIPRASARLRSSRRRRRGFARAAVRRAARAAGDFHRPARRCRASISRRWSRSRPGTT